MDKLRASLRYMIPPLLAMVIVITAGAFYVRDIYALPNFTSALRYVISSLFGILYPRLTIDNGKPVISSKNVNLIDRIGGPGSVMVEPGSAAVFRWLRELSRPVVAATYFVAPFERVAFTAGLDEQQGDREKITSMTRDGIRVTLNDVHFRYRIRNIIENGQRVQRTPERPNPFDPIALTNMIRNLSAGDTWEVAVERAVTGAITDFIAAHTIDYLTAPSRNGQDPRRELQEALMISVRQPLENLGADLIWIDPGHLEIEPQEVNDLRTSMWAAPWIGDSTTKRAFSDQLRQAYRDLGRAQAQAEMIISITQALNNVALSTNSPDNVRRLILARTAQILDSMSSTKPEK